MLNISLFNMYRKLIIPLYIILSNKYNVGDSSVAAIEIVQSC